MNKRILFGMTAAFGLAGAGAMATVLEEPKLSPGQAKFDHPIVWAPEMGRVPLDIPEGAIAKGLKSGSATVRCPVTVAGSISECTLLNETPEGSGMGKASLVAATQFLVNPPQRDGKPVEAMIDIIVPWAPPEGGRTGSSVGRGDMSVGTHPTYTHVVWTNSASYADLLAAVPVKAKAANVSGTAVLRCVFTDTGTLSACHATSELPAGYGFGNAAMDLAPHFKAPAKAADGKSVKDAWVTVNVLFPPGLGDGSAMSVTSVQWLGQPTAQQWASVYPPKAKAAGVTAGSATLSCTVEVDGGLKACGVKDETPAGMGFGAAAMAAVPVFVMKQWNDDGEPMVGRKITFPLTFQVKAGAMTASIGAPLKP
jgi:hypothetical protein